MVFVPGGTSTVGREVSPHTCHTLLLGGSSQMGEGEETVKYRRRKKKRKRKEEETTENGLIQFPTPPVQPVNESSSQSWF